MNMNPASRSLYNDRSFIGTLGKIQGEMQTGRNSANWKSRQIQSESIRELRSPASVNEPRASEMPVQVTTVDELRQCELVDSRRAPVGIELRLAQMMYEKLRREYPSHSKCWRQRLAR